jgi:hypothetical protein
LRGGESAFGTGGLRRISRGGAQHQRLFGECARQDVREIVDRVEDEVVLPGLEAGCQATSSPCRDSPAASKKAVQSIPGARRAKSERVHTLSALRSFADASRVAWLSAIAVSSAKTALPRSSARLTPASASIFRT